MNALLVQCNTYCTTGIFQSERTIYVHLVWWFYCRSHVSSM